MKATHNGAASAVDIIAPPVAENTPLIHGLPSVWPISNVQNTGEIQGISVLPILQVVGGVWTGKSTTAATIDPVKPGEPPRTFVLDTEGSWARLKNEFSVKWVDVRAEANKSMTDTDLRPIHLFLAAKKLVDGIKPGEYTTLVLDTFSDLAAGCHAWVVQNPEIFGKPKGQFNGKDGSIYAWGEVDQFWKTYLHSLAQIFQTIVIVSHEKDQYESGSKTGNKEIRGRDMQELATVALWLGKNEKGHYAKVMKSRLSKPVWKDANGTALKRPIMADLLPDVLIPPMRGYTYPAMLADFMEKTPDHTQLDTNGYDPSKKVLTDDEREEMKLKAVETQLELEKVKLQTALASRKAEMVKSLMDAKLYKDASEIRDTLAELGLLDAAQDLSRLDEVEQALKKAVENAG